MPCGLWTVNCESCLLSDSASTHLRRSLCLLPPSRLSVGKALNWASSRLAVAPTPALKGDRG
jgi:hypothetical protein